ncbi:reverse transcriptase domain-containing protein [Tanacetum coccineum]|uniref:Reverse transcriptase domain-containing protein n=1 Tax=Tanacetum coccineum TaxID=301880 RepID=A0ABQ5HP61_9ASTR
MNMLRPFETLKKELTKAPIMVKPDWSLPFELMCDANDYAVGIDFMGPFPTSYENKYILVEIDYVSKWAKAQALPTNDPRVVVKFLKRLFSRFGIPKALISDRGGHLCNHQLEKALQHYGVTHKFSTVYHPQMSGQVENTNRALKWILEKMVGINLKIWSDKLDDALWAFQTAFKTPICSIPFSMVYSKACHLPVEIEHKAFWALKMCNMDLSEAGKLKSRWSGPFTVKQAYPYGTIKLFNRDGISFKEITNGNLRVGIFEEKKNSSLQTLETMSGLIFSVAKSRHRKKLDFLLIVIFDERSLKVLRKFHWMILGG